MIRLANTYRVARFSRKERCDGIVDHGDAAGGRGATAFRAGAAGGGAPEIIVTDGGACYGGAGSKFTVLTRNKQGALTPILSELGIAVVRPTRHLGWKDIEIGGPGMGRMPVAIAAR